MPNKKTLIRPIKDISLPLHCRGNAPPNDNADSSHHEPLEEEGGSGGGESGGGNGGEKRVEGEQNKAFEGTVTA